MSFTVARSGSVVTITPGAANTDNFVYSEATYPQLPPEGIKCHSVQVVFSAASDKIVIRDGSITGPEIFNFTTLTGDSVSKLLHGKLFQPCLAHADQVYTTPANWRIIFIVD